MRSPSNRKLGSVIRIRISVFTLLYGNVLMSNLCIVRYISDNKHWK